MGKLSGKINFQQLKWGLLLGLITVGFMAGAYYFGYERGEQKKSEKQVEKETVVIDEREVYVNVKEKCGEKDSGVEIKEGKEIKNYCVESLQGKTAFEVLTKLGETNVDFTFDYTEYDFGVMIDSINSYHPDSQSEFWAFYINGEQAQVGVSDYQVENNDELAFKVESI